MDLGGRNILVREDREDRDVKQVRCRRAGAGSRLLRRCAGAGSRECRAAVLAPPLPLWNMDWVLQQRRACKVGHPPPPALPQYNEENGITPPARPPREPREPRAGGRGRGRGRGPPPAEGAEGEQVSQSSGLQIVVNGLPWAYTWKELKDLLAGERHLLGRKFWACQSAVQAAKCSLGV